MAMATAKDMTAGGSTRQPVRRPKAKLAGRIHDLLHPPRTVPMEPERIYVRADLADTSATGIAEHEARVSAARALIAVRKRTGRPIPDDVLALAKG